MLEFLLSEKYFMQRRAGAMHLLFISYHLFSYLFHFQIFKSSNYFNCPVALSKSILEIQAS